MGKTLHTKIRIFDLEGLRYVISKKLLKLKRKQNLKLLKSKFICLMDASKSKKFQKILRELGAVGIFKQPS